MGEIIVSYEHIQKTEAINDYILKKLKKIEKFIHENSIVNVKVKDETPHKNGDNPQFTIIIDVEDINKGKNSDYDISKSDKDLYKCIDMSIDILTEAMRRNHELKADHFKHVKDIISSDVLKDEVEPIIVTANSELV